MNYNYGRYCWNDPCISINSVDFTDSCTDVTSFIKFPQFFGTSPQQLNGLEFVLGEENNLRLLLTTMPDPQDRIFFFGKKIKNEKAFKQLRQDLTNTSRFINNNEPLSSLIYLVYDKGAYVGFGLLQFYSSRNHFLESLFSPGTKQQYKYILDFPYVWANIAIAIHPNYRLMGYGKRIVNGLLNILYTQTNTDIATYISLIQNIGSISIAQRVGFTEVDTTSNDRVFIFVFDRSNKSR